MSNITHISLSSLELLLNQYLKLDPSTLNKLSKLDNKTIKIVLSDWQYAVYLQPSADGFKLVAQQSTAPTTTIEGTFPGFIRTACAGVTAESLFKNGIHISGDAEFGEEIRNIFQKIDIDWEEHLSRVFGDIITQQISWRTRQISKSSKRAFKILGNALSDYLQIESHHLPAKSEVEDFFQNIYHLQNDVERAEARLDRLWKKRAGKRNTISDKKHD